VLAVDPVHTTARADRRRVGEVPSRLGETDDRRGAARVGGELVEHLGAARHERRPEEQILRRIPGERELRERDQVTAGRVGALVGIEHALHVAVEITHDEIELRGSDAEAGHLLRIRDTACMPGGTTLHETPALATAIERSADARTARMLLERAVEEHPGLADELATDPLVRDGVVALACASRSLSSAIVADDSLLDPLRDPDDFARERTVESYRTSWDDVP